MDDLVSWLLIVCFLVNNLSLSSSCLSLPLYAHYRIQPQSLQEAARMQPYASVPTHDNFNEFVPDSQTYSRKLNISDNTAGEPSIPTFPDMRDDLPELETILTPRTHDLPHSPSSTSATSLTIPLRNRLL
ncbi:hypothetical protein BDR04DRAFT_405372 [Suillus decipiens]|nr:hypothetical protein BDR04DRAFT_405372 [Suillus decipiens]